MSANEGKNSNNNSNINQNDKDGILILNQNNNHQNLEFSQKMNPNSNPRNSRQIHFNDDEDLNTKTNIIEVRKYDEGTMRIDNFAENNVSIRNIIDNALFSQLSEINVKLLDFEEDISKKLYKSEGKILPKIDFVEFTLLNQGVNITQFKKYGLGLYVFFLYLIELLVTFGVLFIFVFHYMYCIFYKYYREYEEEYSLFFDYNILSLVSGVQLIKFRKYYISKYGKKVFLEEYKDFDVIYKEYLFSGTIIFIATFLINFGFMLYLQKIYKLYRIENPEIKNYSLIISGKNVPYIKKNEQENDENVSINEQKEAIKNKIIKDLNIKDADINFTFKLSKYYEKMEKFNLLRNNKYRIQYKVNRDKCCCYGCCCFCGKCFCCCCNKKNLTQKIKQIDEQIADIKNEMNIIKNKEIYNPLHIITFYNKEDYDSVYSRYSHSYIKYAIKNLCKRKNDIIYINKAPSPEDIVWKNLEFDKEYRYFKNKFMYFGIGFGYLVISFIIQLLGELFDKIADSIKFLFIMNIIISYFLGLINDWFSDKINSSLINNSNFWSYSDIKFYSILFKTIFKFVNQGILPLLTYYIFAEKNDDYFNFVSKIFVFIEMDGFGYPMIDWLYSVVLTKGKDMYESTQKMMSFENIEKEISDKVINKEGLSRLELEQSYEKKEMDLEGNYSDILSIYWITMFYMSIYPIGIIQSFLNLLFKYIIEKNFLLNVYKRPEYINPQFGFLCFNFFNFGFFLFLCGDIIFFRNEDNKKSFGTVYIIFMFIILLIPFYLIGKLIMYITNYCCLKEKESETLNNIKQRIKSDYRLFNPCYQKEKISQIFLEFKRKDFLTESQYKELTNKVNKLNDLDLYKLQQSLRTPKFMTFEERKITSGFLYDNPSRIIYDEEKEKLYYFLMQLGFISYLEEGNVLKPKKKRFEYIEGVHIRSNELINLSMQENLSNSDSGYFRTFKKYGDNDDQLIIAYVDNEMDVKIFDVFNRQVLNDVKDLKHTKKIVCVDYFTKKTQDKEIFYLVSLALDNTMIISDLLINEKDTSKVIYKIGDTFQDNQEKENSIFSLSSASHDGGTWLFTSYYYDQNFKIFNSEGECLHVVKNNNYIISLEGLYFTDENTYICVRSPDSVNLYINEYFIREIENIKESAYINFKVIQPMTFIFDYKLVMLTIIKRDLTSYFIKLFDIFPIFPLFTPIFNFFIKFTFGQTLNNEVHIPMNEEIQKKIQLNSPTNVFNFFVNLDSTEEKRKSMIRFMESNDNEKYNIGNILLWGDYLIVGTPFNYLDIIDMEKRIKVGVINNTESIKSIYDNKEEELTDIIIYNISDGITDPEYGASFIMRDNKGKIQYIRPAKIKDKLNYKLIKSDEFFNDLPDNKKLDHILFSTRFYFIYSLISYLVPLATAIGGHLTKEDSPDNSLYTASFILYIIYAFFSIWFKGCVYDIKDESNRKRTCTKIMIYLCLAIKICANSMISFRFCHGNKTGIVFVSMLIGVFFIHLNLNFLIYCCKIKFLLKTYWLGFLFYQLSRFCILLFFIISILSKVSHVETYIYAGILCIVLIYMYMANYFNTLMKDIVYNSYIQAVFNYPVEWMNLFCCWCKVPKDCIQDIDTQFCVCDSFFVAAAQVLGWIILIAVILAILMLYYICMFILALLSGGKKSSDND